MGKNPMDSLLIYGLILKKPPEEILWEIFYLD